MPADEPQLPPSIPSPPDHLSEQAKKHWLVLTEQLQRADILTSIDGEGLEMLCEAYTNWVKANNEVKKGGFIVENPETGVSKISPYVALSDKYFSQLRYMIVEYGMTPSSRARVKVAKSADKAKDKKSRFFSD